MRSRNWIIDSHSGSSNVLLQCKVSSDEFMSIFIRADEKGDVQHLPNQTDLYTLHCVHNIGVVQGVYPLIRKQLVYTISVSLHLAGSFISVCGFFVQ